MKRRQFIALFLSYLVGWTTGNGLLPLLPVYASQLGAGPVFTGYYLAFVYAALTAGTLVGGWLSDGLQRRRAVIIAVGTVGVPVVWLMGSPANTYVLGLLTSVLWFMGGMWMVMLSTLTGLSAEDSQRGRVFGLLGMTPALGSLLGGLTMGSVADRWGYPTLFRAAALWWGVLPLCAWLLEDQVVAGDTSVEGSLAGRRSALGARFLLFLCAGLLAGVASFVAIMGRSLALMGLGSSSAAVSSTVAVSGAVSLAQAPLLGELSDRMDRARLLVLSCLVGASGLLVLSAAAQLWHFWVAAALLTLLSVNGPVGQALVTDWVPKESLGRALSRLQATTWIGGIVGFALTGHAIERLGIRFTFAGAALLAVIAAGLLVPVRGAGAARTPAEAA